MTITAKIMFSEFGVWLSTRARRILRSRAVQTHALAFVSGLLIGIVGLRMAAPAAEISKAESPIADNTEAVIEALPEKVERPVDNDAACVARVLYGIRDYGLSTESKTAVIEVIKNRAADTQCEFRTVNTIEAVCNQPEQWQGYIADGSYLKEDYDLALEVLHDASGARTIPEGCYFLVVRSGEVIARTEWDGGNEWSVR